MADGVVLPGTGGTVATDDTASGQVQLFKLAYSADGSATLVGVDVNGLDVDVTRLPTISGTVAVSALPGIGGTVVVSSGTLAVSSLPGVSGTVAVSAMPAGLSAANVPGTSVAVSTTAQIAAANASRKTLFIGNDHTSSVLYLKLGTTAVVSQGIRVPPGATGVVKGDEYTGRVDGIASSGTITVCVSEA